MGGYLQALNQDSLNEKIAKKERSCLPRRDELAQYWLVFHADRFLSSGLFNSDVSVELNTKLFDRVYFYEPSGDAWRLI